MIVLFRWLLHSGLYVYKTIVINSLSHHKMKFLVNTANQK